MLIATVMLALMMLTSFRTIREEAFVAEEVQGGCIGREVATLSSSDILAFTHSKVGFRSQAEGQENIVKWLNALSLLNVRSRCVFHQGDRQQDEVCGSTVFCFAYNFLATMACTAMKNETMTR